MVKLKFTLLLSIIITVCSYGQKEIYKSENPYKYSGYGNKESLAISNPEKDEIVLLIEDSKSTNLILLNETRKEIGNLKTDRLASNFKNFLGYNLYEDGSYAIIFSDTKHKKFGLLKFNFTANSIEQKTLDFSYKKQKYVTSFTQNGNFYFMTALKGGSDDVNFFKFENNDTFSNKTISFSFITTSVDGYKSRPIDLLTTRYLGNGSLTKINPISPSSITTTSDPNKLYQIGNEVFITVDKSKNVTKVVRVNLEDFSIKTESFEKPKLEPKEGQTAYFTKHNSFIHDGLIYQVKASSTEMKLTAKKLIDKEIVQELNVKKKDSITFKNGPIYQEKKSSSIFAPESERQLEKTSKFLRKMSNANAGITVDIVNEKMQLTIGGHIERKSSGGGFGVAGFAGGGLVGGLAVAGISSGFNPTFTNYNSYSSSKTTYINCLFDNEFNHLQGDFKDNIFDRIKEYEESFTKKQLSDGTYEYIFNPEVKIKLKNVFYHKDKHYIGYINSKTKTYHLVEFSNELIKED